MRCEFKPERSIAMRKMRASPRWSSTSTSPKKVTRAVECSNLSGDLKKELMWPTERVVFALGWCMLA